jgi:hypothetical protein
MVENEKSDEIELPENCQPKATSSIDYEIVDCLAEHPACNFALHFGYGMLCRHPRRKEIVEKFKAMKNLKGQQE